MLQPISESAESPKDELSKNEKDGLPRDGKELETAPECSVECKTDQHKTNKETQVDIQDVVTDKPCIQEQELENICVVKETMITQPKDDYSACFKLIEKFQEAVLDNAVRIIQAAFKLFTQRRRFLRLKKAATVIQRNVRRWLQQRHSRMRPCSLHLNNGKPEEHNALCQKTVSSDDGLYQSSSVEEESFDATPHIEFEHCEIDQGVGHQEEDSKTEFLQLDTWLILFKDLQIEEPDSLSLTDSGIDCCSDTAVEAAIEENNMELKPSSGENLGLRVSPVAGQGLCIDDLHLEMPEGQLAKKGNFLDTKPESLIHSESNIS